MMKLTDKELAEWKEAFAKSGIKYDTDAEYQEAIYNLVGYIDTLIQMDQQQKSSMR